MSGEENRDGDDGVRAVSTNAAQVLSLLQELLHQNQIQREHLIGLNQFYETSAEGEQIARERALSSHVHLLEQSLEKLKEEVENQKKTNAQLEARLSRLMKRSDP